MTGSLAARAPFLEHFDPEKPISVETDAPGFAVSGIMSQPATGPGGKAYHPTAFTPGR